MFSLACSLKRMESMSTKPAVEMMRIRTSVICTRIWSDASLANSEPTMSLRHDCMNRAMLARESLSEEIEETLSPNFLSSTSSETSTIPSFSRTAALRRRALAALMSFRTVSVKCAYERITAVESGNLSMSHLYSDLAVLTASSYWWTAATMSSITAGEGRPYAVEPDFSCLITRLKNFFMSDRQFWCDLRAIDILESNSMRFTALRDPPSPRLELTESWVARRMTA
mmetsp:Transcript_53476/g.127212  ORF Transcript_53476/g.127212 Transcript_53476/m.127212 type:complete len:227 (-) Transcript_53476:53-733(-)